MTMTQKQFNQTDATRIQSGELLGAIKTIDGCPVRILAWDVKSRYCIAGTVTLGEDEYVKQWTIEGKADFHRSRPTPYDLILEVEGGEV